MSSLCGVLALAHPGATDDLMREKQDIVLEALNACVCHVYWTSVRRDAATHEITELAVGLSGGHVHVDRRVVDFRDVQKLEGGIVVAAWGPVLLEIGLQRGWYVRWPIVVGRDVDRKGWVC